MQALKVARVPAPVIPATMTVKAAIPRIHSEAGCAVGVVDGKRLVGTLTKDDVLKKVVKPGRDAGRVEVREIMRPLAASIGPEADTAEALRLMLAKRQCFLPIVGAGGEALGWLAVCNLFNEQVHLLDDQLDTLASYLGADTPGD